MTDLLLSLWALVPPGAQLGIVAMLLLLLVAWAVVSVWAGLVNAEIRVMRQRGIEVPLALAVKAERLNLLALNPDKLAEVRAWIAAARVPAAPEAELSRLRDEVARLRARESEAPRG